MRGTLRLKGADSSGFRDHKGKKGQYGGSVRRDVTMTGVQNDAYLAAHGDARDIQEAKLLWKRYKSKFYTGDEPRNYKLGEFITNAWEFTDKEEDGGIGMYTKLDYNGISVWDNNITCRMTIYDKNNNKIGRLERSLDTLTGDVYNSYFSINDDSFKKHGFASALFENAERVYNRNGIQSSSVSAALSNGAYTWAQMGYDFDKRSTYAGTFRRLFDSRWTANFRSSAPLSINKMEHSWDFANFVHPTNGSKLGQIWMSGEAWHGYKLFDAGMHREPTFSGNIVGKYYYEYKRLSRLRAKGLLKEIIMNKQTPVEEIKAPIPEEGNDGDYWASQEEGNDGEYWASQEEEDGWYELIKNNPLFHPELAPDVPDGKAILHTKQVK